MLGHYETMETWTWGGGNESQWSVFLSLVICVHYETMETCIYNLHDYHLLGWLNPPKTAMNVGLLLFHGKFIHLKWK